MTQPRHPRNPKPIRAPLPVAGVDGARAKAMYPGTFDPVTNGHLDIIDRARGMFSELTVVVSGNSGKTPLFSQAERVELMRDSLSELGKGWEKVKVAAWDGLVVEFARENGIDVIVRGLRAASDFEYEFMMASMNRDLSPAVETVFLMTSPSLYFISSSMVRELHRYGGDIGPYVPDPVGDRLITRISVAASESPRKNEDSPRRRGRRERK